MRKNDSLRMQKGLELLFNYLLKSVYHKEGNNVYTQNTVCI